jgi:hypothetical protein
MAGLEGENNLTVTTLTFSSKSVKIDKNGLKFQFPWRKMKIFQLHYDGLVCVKVPSLRMI